MLAAGCAAATAATSARRAFYLGGISHILEMDDLHRELRHPSRLRRHPGRLGGRR